MEISLQQEFKQEQYMSAWIYISFPNPTKPEGSNVIGLFITNRKSTEEKLSWKERKVLKKLKAKIRDGEITDFSSQFLSRKFKNLYYETYRSNNNYTNNKKKYNPRDRNDSVKATKATPKNKGKNTPHQKHQQKESK